MRCACPYLIAPCCVGKVKFGFESHDTTQPSSDAAGDRASQAPAARGRRAAQQRALALQRSKASGGPRRRTGGLAAEKKRRRGFINNMGLEKDGVLLQLKYPRSRWLRKQLGEWRQSQLLPGPAAATDPLALDSAGSEDQQPGSSSKPQEIPEAVAGCV